MNERASKPSGVNNEAEAGRPIDTEALTVAFVDQSHDAEEAARDAAERRWREEINGSTGIRRILKNIWMGENGIAGRYYFEKYKKEALERIQSEQDINLPYSSDKHARKAAQMATIYRFKSDYDEMVHGGAGELRREVSDDSEFGQSVKHLIRQYVAGEISSPEAMNEEKNRIISRLPREDSDLIGQGRVRIDNLTQIAESVKGMVEHGDSIDRILSDMKIYSGESRAGVRTQLHLSETDKAIERLQKMKLGSLVGPETLSLAAAVATSVGRAGRGTLLRALNVTVAPGVIGGIFAGMRENKRIKEDRATHAREMAQGGMFGGEDKRRGQMEESRYKTVPALQMIEILESVFPDSEEGVAPEDARSYYEIIADIETRIRLSDERGIDLISYSDATSVEIERFDLDLARARAKVALKNNLGSLPEDFRNTLGIDDEEDVDNVLSGYVDTMAEVSTDIDEKDKAFTKLKRRRVASAAATGFASSLFLGVAAQEAVSFADSSYDGLAEHLIKGGHPSEDGRQTILERIFNHQPASTDIETIVPSNSYTSYELPDGGALELPEGYEMNINQDSPISIFYNGESVSGDILTDENGSFSAESIDSLKEKGFVISDLSYWESKTDVATENLTVEQYVDYYKDSTTNVTREFWYDNNTEVFDRNELALHWSGDGGMGSDGSVQLTTAAMTPDDSYYGDNYAPWPDLAQEGRLKVAISASIDTQNQVFMVDVNPDGSISIPPDHPAFNLFTYSEGQMQFNGGYVEVVELRGDIDGITHMAPLATVVGDNSIADIPTEVEHVTETRVPHYKITPPPIENVIDVPERVIEGFGAPAVVTRRPLEDLARLNRYRNGYNIDRRRSEYIDQLDDFSPRLREDNEAELNLSEELPWYEARLADREGDEYVEEINELINGSSELRNLSEDTEMLVTIPVAAATEQDNIYHTLSLYAQQDADAIGKTAILLNVNYLDAVVSDSKAMRAIEKTKAEIARARRDFPQLKIATIERRYDVNQVNETGGVIGYVAKDLMNTALMAINNKVKSAEWNRDKDVLIVRNDADVRGISRHYFREMLAQHKRYPGVDVLKGVTRYGTDLYKDNPIFGTIMNLSSNLAILASRDGSVHTGGANFAVKASTLAAVGGLGRTLYTGVASDDVEVGRRVYAARTGDIRMLSDGGYRQANIDIKNRQIGRLVGGAAIDTDAERFLRRYNRGEWWQSVWSGDRGAGSFSSGDGGYSPRDSGRRGRRRTGDEIKLLEHNISEELSLVPEEHRRQVLSLIFKNTPGAYTIDEVGGKAIFSLTKAGRKHFAEYLKRDPRGRKISFGQRTREQLYGYTRDGRVRSGSMIQ